MDKDAFSFANLSNLTFVEELYHTYLKNPMSIDSSWRYFFEGMEFAGVGPSSGPVKGSDDLRIYHLISAYRTYGHLLARFNPIATKPPEEPKELKLEALGFKKEELNNSFPTCGFLKEESAPLQTIIDALQKTYCRTIGIEYMGLGLPELEAWIQKRIEPFFELRLEAKNKMAILHELNRAELFESFIHTKYVGQKRFSLEGAETLIPMLKFLLDKGATLDVSEVFLGMAHRGRLNVLANILGKSYASIFHEFEDHYSPETQEGTGDVKYHRGFAGICTTEDNKEISVLLAANPSHLESVDPVVEGEVRARQELKERSLQKQIIPILIHGDAALAGQGVIYETMQLSKLTGYSTGGTIHIVINNQIGFTTLPKDGRSTRYCTDIAHAFSAPVFHVDAEDPQGCVVAAQLSIEIRQRFGLDVFIDLNSYRKYGHNEGDEPLFTQPLEYQLIKEKKSIRELFKEQLLHEGILDLKTAAGLEESFKKQLQEALEKVHSEVPPLSAKTEEKEEKSVQTAVAADVLVSLAKEFCTVPEGFHLNSKIQRLLKERLNMVERPNEKILDWGMAEHLGLASLVYEGVNVRLSGQDSRRGTFSHRHALWVDQENEQKYFPLSHLQSANGKKGLFDVFNSPLSEFAVLGFEFGYSLFHPQALVIWEAQYGDFFNGAQIIIDQYIAASEQKWSHRSNLTLMLPHGYEGAGPEHSSGRIERFLQLCGEENMRVANCSTPAQLFHLLRDQAFRRPKKPLILFTPKALLRHPKFVSSLNDLATGCFEEVLVDKIEEMPTTLVLCSGKIYYDLLAEKEKRGIKNYLFVRIEQLYPFPEEKLQNIFKEHTGFSRCLWVQEEHSNMGAWDFVRPLIDRALQGKMQVRYIGRERSASVAAGSYALHKKQQSLLMDEVFKI